MDFFTKHLLAQNSNTSPEVLRDLSNADDFIVRGFVAQNPSTPINALEQLAEDDYAWVRHCVMNNPNSTEEIIMLAKATEFIMNRRGELWN
jgi:hypothetical protein